MLSHNTQIESYLFNTCIEFPPYQIGPAQFNIVFLAYEFWSSTGKYEAYL